MQISKKGNSLKKLNKCKQTQENTGSELHTMNRKVTGKYISKEDMYIQTTNTWFAFICIIIILNVINGYLSYNGNERQSQNDSK